MNCETFRRRLEDLPAGPFEVDRNPPDDLAAHVRSCSDCRALMNEDMFWKRFFAAAPEPEPEGSAWPGVMAKIQKRMDSADSFSDALLLWTRRLAPAFALVLLLLGGAVFFQGNSGYLQESDLPGLGLLEPEAVLDQWAGVPEE